jgi:hypothetical protein
VLHTPAVTEKQAENFGASFVVKALPIAKMSARIGKIILVFFIMMCFFPEKQ